MGKNVTGGILLMLAGAAAISLVATDKGKQILSILKSGTASGSSTSGRGGGFGTSGGTGSGTTSWGAGGFGGGATK